MTDQDIVDIGGLIHARWSETFITNQKVNDEKDLGEKDWAEFHVIRRQNAQENADHWWGVKQRYMAEHRAVFERMLP